MSAPRKTSWCVTVVSDSAQFTPYYGNSEQFARHDLTTALQSIVITGGTALITLRRDHALVSRTNVIAGQHITEEFTPPASKADAQTIAAFEKELGK